MNSQLHCGVAKPSLLGRLTLCKASGFPLTFSPDLSPSLWSNLGGSWIPLSFLSSYLLHIGGVLGGSLNSSKPSAHMPLGD